MLLTLLGLAFFVGLVVVVLAIAIGGLAGGGSGPDTVVRRTMTSGDASQTIAVIPVSGLILDSTEKQFRRHLETAMNDANVKAVVIDVSSPGGTVTDSNQMYATLRAFKTEKPNLPVVVHMDDVAASGGYYLACAADTIVAEESTITGSIGVMIQFPQLSEFAEKTGIRLRTIVADGSPKKDFLDTFTEPDDEDVRAVKELLNDQYELFKSVVEAGRGSRIREAGSSVDEVASGAVFLGPKAKELGLVDQIGFFEDAVSIAATAAGLNNPNVVRYDRPPTLIETLGLASSPNLSSALESDSAKSLAVELLHEASSPRMLYLYNGAR